MTPLLRITFGVLRRCFRDAPEDLDAVDFRGRSLPWFFLWLIVVAAASLILHADKTERTWIIVGVAIVLVPFYWLRVARHFHPARHGGRDIKRAGRWTYRRFRSAGKKADGE